MRGCYYLLLFSILFPQRCLAATLMAARPSTFSNVPSSVGDEEEYKEDPMGGMSFQELMREAVNIKGAQMSKGRKRFDKAPEYFQHTLFLGETDEAVKKARLLPVVGEGETRYTAAAAIKTEGNIFFQTKPKPKLKQALECYKRALACIHYFEPTVEDWKKKGMQDDHMRVIDASEGTHEACVGLRELKVSILLNIAACFLKMKDWPNCVRASSDALEHDSNSVKALYRRAIARLRAPSSGGVEFNFALKDLKRAFEIDPNNKDVRHELKKLRTELKRQKQSDKSTYSDMFQRGEIYDDVRKEKEGADGTKETGPAEEEFDENAIQKKLDERIAENEKELKIAKQQMENWSSLARQAENDGDEERARDLRARVTRVEQAVADWEIKNKEKMSKISEARKAEQKRQDAVDFLNPTPQMIAEAKEQGIDLEDENVRKYIMELQERRMRGENIDDIDEDEAAEKSRERMASPPSSGINMTIVWVAMFSLLAYRLFTTGLVWELMEALGLAGSDEEGSRIFPEESDENILDDGWDDTDF